LVTDVPSDGDAHADPPAAGFGTDGIVAVIEALPEVEPVNTPLVATIVPEPVPAAVLHVAESVTTTGVPSLRVSVATNDCVLPAGTVGSVFGVTARLTPQAPDTITVSLPVTGLAPRLNVRMTLLTFLKDVTVVPPVYPLVVSTIATLSSALVEVTREETS
jgi:hypothetical protein